MDDQPPNSGARRVRWRDLASPYKALFAVTATLVVLSIVGGAFWSLAGALFIVFGQDVGIGVFFAVGGALTMAGAVAAARSWRHMRRPGRTATGLGTLGALWAGLILAAILAEGSNNWALPLILPVLALAPILWFLRASLPDSETGTEDPDLPPRIAAMLAEPPAQVSPNSKPPRHRGLYY